MCEGSEISPVLGVSAALFGFSVVVLARKRWVVGGVTLGLALLAFLFTFTLAC